MTDLSSPSQIDSIPEEQYKDLYIEDLYNLILDNKITENQAKGMILEISTYIALRNLGIFPIPLHNPFNENYACDNHLSIDLIFYYKNKLYGIECKNISPNWNGINREWIDREIINRFSRLKHLFDIDFKIVVTSVHKDLMLKYLPEEYKILEVGYQAYPENIVKLIFSLVKLISSLFRQIEVGNSIVYSHGYNKSKVYEDKLRYIQTKLKELYEDTKSME